MKKITYLNPPNHKRFMKAIPGGHNLFVADVEVAKRIENLYNKFKVKIDKKLLTYLNDSCYEGILRGNNLN